MSIIVKYCTTHEVGYVNYKNMVLLPSKDALKCYLELKNKGAKVLGIDGFFLLPNYNIQPSMQDSIDVTADPYLSSSENDIHDSILKFLSEPHCDVFFEFIVDE